MFLRLLLAVFSFCFVFRNLDAASFQFDSHVDEILKECQVPGIAIGLVIDGKTIWMKGYGWRDLEKGLPVDEHTVFGVGSCTKAFTALLLGQLVEAGRISWDDPVTRHLPEFRLYDSALTQQVTIRDLIAHRTGFPRYDAIWFSNQMQRQKILDLLPYLQPACGLREKFYYNNIMYAVAGMVVEKMHGQSWESVMETRLLQPLMMEDANVSVTTTSQGSNFALPYAEIHGKISELTFLNVEPVAPGGALNASVSDMVQWIHLQLGKGDFLGKTFAREETFHEMATPHMTIEGGDFSAYGLGWFLGNYKGHQTISHVGSIRGFTSELFLMPKQKIGIVILTNSSSDGPFALTALRNLILDEVLGGEQFGWIEKMKRARQEQLHGRRVNPLDYEISHEERLDDYVGHYRHPAYGLVKVEREENHLMATYGWIHFPLYFESQHHFIGYIPELLIFGEKRPIDATFIPDYWWGEFQEIQLSLEPAAAPLSFIKE